MISRLGPLDAVLLAVAGVLFAVQYWPRLRDNPTWRAMLTPLASMIGSGFLVIAPVLAFVAGPWAVEAMLALCALAWLFGSAIRFNIRRLASSHPREAGIARWDRAAEGLLILGYFVSVAYYLNLLGAFLLKGAGIVDPVLARSLTTGIVLAVGLLGAARGFGGIERVEAASVSVKLAVIGALLVALVAFHLEGRAPPPPESGGEAPWTAFRTLLGCVLLVQGFETSRFLGARYDTETRIRSMRWAQGLSTVVYVIFIALVLPLVPAERLDAGSETAIIDIVSGVSASLGPMLIAAAIASQLSAAMADMGGSGGLLNELSGHRLTQQLTYGAITVMVVGLTWTVDLFAIIAVASRAFAAYYGMQCALAAWLAQGRPVRRVLYGAGSLAALAVVALGIPAG